MTARFSARALVAGLALALVAVPFGLLLLFVEDRWPPLLRIDRGARDDLHRYAVHHDGFVGAMKLLSTIGSANVYVPVLLVACGWLLWRRLPRLAVFAVVTAGLSPLLNGLVKGAVHRARPVVADPVAHAPGQSFPSGHAQSAVVVYGILVLVFLPALRGRARPAAVAAASLLVLAIGFSRVALGVHFVSDVLAGYVLGAAWVAATTAAFSAWRRDRGEPPVEPSEGLAPESAGAL